MLTESEPENLEMPLGVLVLAFAVLAFCAASKLNQTRWEKAQLERALSDCISKTADPPN